MSKKFQLVAVGGTFDHFHLGHQHLLNTAYANAQTVVIGLTKPVLYQKKILFQQIESYAKRKNNLLKFLSRRNLIKNTFIIPLTDPFGPALTNTKIEAVIVSKQTLSGAKALNVRRLSANLPPLPLVVTEMIKDDAGEHLSSTGIRQGLISETGCTYSRCLDWGWNLSPTLKKFLEKPHGQIYTKITPEVISQASRKNLPVIAVGDQVIQQAAANKVPLSHLIYDSLIQRRPISFDYLRYYPYPLQMVNNPSGQITKGATAAVKRLLQQKQGALVVNGEEDLLAVPALLLAPLGSLIIYGQPGSGAVIMTATAAKKSQVAQAVTKAKLDN